MTTHEGNLFNKFCQFLRQDVLQAICTGLASKGVTVTVDELQEFIKAPATFPQYSNNLITSPLSSNTIPGMGGVNPVEPAKSTRGGKSRKAKADLPPAPDHKRCVYIYTRGKTEKIGTRCPAESEDNEYLCKKCKTLKTAMKQVQELTSNPDKLSKMRGGGGVNTQFSDKFVPQNTTSMQQPIKFNYKQIAPGLLCEVSTGHNLVFRPDVNSPDKQHTCIGYLDQKANGSTIAELTPEKIELCNKYGVSYVRPKSSGPTPFNVNPPLNSPLQFPGQPQLQSQPQLPSLPQLQSQTQNSGPGSLNLLPMNNAPINSGLGMTPFMGLPMTSSLNTVSMSSETKLPVNQPASSSAPMNSGSLNMMPGLPLNTKPAISLSSLPGSGMEPITAMESVGEPDDDEDNDENGEDMDD